MTSTCAVATAAVLQMFLGISFFIKQNPDMCSTAPNLASWIFLIAFLDILSDVQLYPGRYMHLPYILQLIAEILMAVLVTEFATLIVWCTLERICCKLCKILLLLGGVPPTYYYNWETYILGVVTTAISLAFLLCAGHATDHFYVMRKKSIRVYRKIVHHMRQIFLKCRQKLAKAKIPADNSKICATYECNQAEEDKRNASGEQMYASDKQTKRRHSRSKSRR